MKARLWKKLLLVLCFLTIELVWTSAARGDIELGYSTYTGVIHYPDEIGGITTYT